jgi:hypothetical protein
MRLDSGERGVRHPALALSIALTVKPLRLWLLLLLAVLLPIRGAVAAAMLCPAGGAGPQAEARVAQHGHPASHHDMATMDAHEAAGDPGGSGHPEGHDPDAQGKCPVCSACCSLTPLVSEAPRLSEPTALSHVGFPELSTPAPSFLSDGQERPPRTV